MVDPVLRFVHSVLRIILTISILLLTSCSHAKPTATLEPIMVQYSFATQPWLVNLNNCAGKSIVMSELRVANSQDPQSVDLVLRFGHPDILTTPSYQIGTDDLIVIVNPQNPVNQLTSDQVRGIFTGQIQTWEVINGTKTQVHVWVFPPGEDVQQIFDQSALGGSPINSQARLANNPTEMSQVVSKDINAIGLLTRRWKTGHLSDVFTVASGLPVLAITQSVPHGVLTQILACLEK